MNLLNSNKNSKEFNLWLRISIIIAGLILITIGFLIGNISDEKECSNNPLGYGVKVLNDINNQEFTCSCYAENLRISFNENGFIKDYLG